MSSWAASRIKLTLLFDASKESAKPSHIGPLVFAGAPRDLDRSPLSTGPFPSLTRCWEKGQGPQHPGWVRTPACLHVHVPPLATRTSISIIRLTQIIRRINCSAPRDSIPVRGAIFISQPKGPYRKQVGIRVLTPRCLITTYCRLVVDVTNGSRAESTHTPSVLRLTIECTAADQNTSRSNFGTSLWVRFAIRVGDKTRSPHVSTYLFLA